LAALIHLAAVISLSAQEIRDAVRTALAEDVGPGDVTTEATVPEDTPAKGRMVARQALTLAGVEFARSAFTQIDPGVQVDIDAADGRQVNPGGLILHVSGPARALLTAERVALNFVQRLSGVATRTRAFVDAVEGTGARILDTRKTTPGWRRFEKYAVSAGGGTNHRFGLFDMVLIKDNHLATLAGLAANPIKAAVDRSRAAYPNLRVEIEADTLEQVRAALDAKPDIILMDNMSLRQLREAVSICKGIVQTEASGGVNLQTVRSIAETGVDFISVGALTHSAAAVDIALDFVA
jgi:nicotinate-nucleotide pyrophosphorylase (carboxylating)